MMAVGSESTAFQTIIMKTKGKKKLVKEKINKTFKKKMNQINGFNFHLNRIRVSSEQSPRFPPAGGPGHEGAPGGVGGLPETLAAATPAEAAGVGSGLTGGLLGPLDVARLPFPHLHSTQTTGLHTQRSI